MDTFYIDKNADIGVTWRRAGWREFFTESPRESHSFVADCSISDLWSAVSATRASMEAQDVSNCQHFVQESFQELASRGLIQPPSGQSFPLRNQQVAEWLQWTGHLDSTFKRQAGGEQGFGDGIFKWISCLQCKA